ncbi:MAG: hypothetical protein P8M78_04150 [Myxococcota bacterium]|nr:hypothetical protein [Myxococcota bacterium]
MSNQNHIWRKRLLWVVAGAGAIWVIASVVLSRADGPVFIFAGGPLQSGQTVELEEIDWRSVNALHELEMELVGSGSSLTLWFSVSEGVPYVACDLDCVGGVLTRWPQEVERDGRVVVRIEDQKAAGWLVHVPHGTEEYVVARAGRSVKYSGGDGGRAAAETAAHGAVVGVGEALTGRAARSEPGDRLYRIEPRPQ